MHRVTPYVWLRTEGKKKLWNITQARARYPGRFRDRNLARRDAGKIVRQLSRASLNLVLWSTMKHEMGSERLVSALKIWWS